MIGSFNWIDFIIFLILLYFFLDSFHHNFFVIFFEFLSLLISLLLGFKFYTKLAQILSTNFTLPGFLSKAIGFFLVVIFGEFIIFSIFLFIAKKIPSKLRSFKILGFLKFIFGLLDGFLIIVFLLPLALSLPVPQIIKDAVTSSKVGSYISANTLYFEKKYNDIFGSLVKEGLNFISVTSGSEIKIPLNVGKRELTYDYQNEETMYSLINLERTKAGLNPLSKREESVPVAREYAKKMWEEGYFSHYSLEREDVSVRLDKAGIKYRVVGENLALAPTLIIAHNGLMNSESHRQNILDPNYSKVAIGIVDNGIYGKIFVQIFTD